MDLQGFVLTVFASSGIATTASALLLKTWVTQRIKFHFDTALQNLKHEHSGELQNLKHQHDQALAGLNAQLQFQAGQSLEGIRSKYAEQLEEVRASYQQEISQALETLRNQYVIQQERIKAGLTAQVQDDLDMYKQRRDKYPALQEVIYRIRNVTRAIVQDPKTPEAAGLTDRVKELEEKLYQQALYLQRDNVFKAVHSFKNDSRTFDMVFSDYRFSEWDDGGALRDKSLTQLLDLYKRIDAQHEAITRDLAMLISAAPPDGSAA